MADLTIDQAIDIGYATLPRFKKESLEMTYNDITHELYNLWFGMAERDSGDSIKSWVTLGDTGNAKMVSLWEEDTHNTVNTDDEIKVDWTHSTTNLEYERREIAMNTGNKVRIYNYLKSKMQNMFREWAELLQPKLILSPTSSTDKKNPHGLASWLSLGTDNSTGAWTGYSGVYNDGSGTTYNVGGIASTASSKARWGSYYADHNGEFGNNIVDLMARAYRKTHFIPPMVPRKIGAEHNPVSNFRLYSNDVVIGNFEAMARAQDDKVGPDIVKYQGIPHFKGVPFIYVDELDTTRASLRGTNPIYGVNHTYFKCVVLKENDFVVGRPRQRDNAHNVLAVDADVSFGILCTNRQKAGFLISQQ